MVEAGENSSNGQILATAKGGRVHSGEGKA